MKIIEAFLNAAILLTAFKPLNFLQPLIVDFGRMIGAFPRL